MIRVGLTSMKSTYHQNVIYLLVILLTTYLTLATSQVLTTIDSVENITFSTPRLRYETNPRQPYGKYLNIAFSVFGIDFNFQDMELYSSSVQNTDVEIHNNDQIEHMNMAQSTYRAVYVDNQGNNSYAIITLNPENDDIFAVISQNREKYYIQPRSLITQLTHSNQFNQATLQRLQSSSSSSSSSSTTLAYKASDIKYYNENGEAYSRCGAIDPRSSDDKHHTTDVDLNMIKNPLHLDSVIKNLEDNTIQESESSVSPLSSSFERELNRLKLWEDCVPNLGITRYTLNVNFVADVGFFNIFKTQSATESYIQNMIVVLNQIYHEQMGINVHIGKMVVFQTLNSVPFNKLGHNEPGSTCGDYKIGAYLEDIRVWSQNNPDIIPYQGLWHGLTNCYPWGTVGLAFVGTTCWYNYRVGVSGYTGGGFPEIVAHELGHNMGSSHAWEYGGTQGGVGGCMDYGTGCWLKADDPDNPNGFGFHRGSQGPICGHLSGTLSNTNNIGNSNESCWTSQPADTPFWVTNGWSSCSSKDPCVSGKKKRTFVCQKSGITVGDTQCDASTKPDIIETCTDGICVPLWHTGSWSSCSSKDPCISGFRARPVVCKRGQVTVENSQCKQQMPLQSESCTTEGTCRGIWTPSEWDPCSSKDPCLEGSQQRVVSCKSSTTKFDIDVKYCTSEKPNTSQKCSGAGSCPSTITTLTVDNVSFAAASTMKIKWTIKEHSSAPSKITTGYISLHKKSDPSYVVVLGTSLVSMEGLTYKLTKTIGQGADYVVKLSASGYNTMSSSVFSIGSPCGLIACQHASTCDAELAQCICPPGYSGIDCSISKCSNIQCQNGGTCSLDTGKCICLTGWSGSTCSNADSCSSSFDFKRCGDRGYLTNSANTCNQDCTCYTNWKSLPSSLSSVSKTASQCTECSLQCGVGKPNSTCTACECPLGTHGSNCSCRHLHVSFGVQSQGWMKTELSRHQNWVDSIEKEISSMTQLPLHLIQDLPTTTSSDSTDSTDSMISLRFLSTDTCNSSNNVLTTDELGAIDPKLSSAYTAGDNLSAIFKKKDFGTYNSAPILPKKINFDAGLMLTDTQCSGAECPKSIPKTDSNPEDDDGLSGGAIAGIVIGVLVLIAIIIIIVIFILRRSKENGTTTTTAAKQQSTNDIQLSNAATQTSAVMIPNSSAPPIPPRA